MTKFLACLAVLACLSACGYTAKPLTEIDLGRSATAPSTGSVTVELETGRIVNAAAADIVVPLSHGGFVTVPGDRSDTWAFNRRNQEQFVENFTLQLVKHGLCGSVIVPGTGPIADTHIEIAFTSTVRDQMFNTYILDVTMTMMAGDRTQVTSHHIVSDDDETVFQKAFKNPNNARDKAARKLMAALIADVEHWNSEKG